jgi:hypothetical protein
VQNINNLQERNGTRLMPSDLSALGPSEETHSVAHQSEMLARAFLGELEGISGPDLPGVSAIDLLAQALLGRQEEEAVINQLVDEVVARARALQVGEKAQPPLMEDTVLAPGAGKGSVAVAGAEAPARPMPSRAAPGSSPLRLWFDHGLGDCANFAHVLELYRRRGYEIELHCADDKAIAFSPVGVTRIPLEDPLDYVRFPETRDPELDTVAQYWLYNKTAASVSGQPLPDIGTPEQLWRELCAVRLDSRPHIGWDAWGRVESFLRDLPRPVVLLHSMGNTFQDAKNLPEHVALATYQEILERMDGTLVLLDWDNRVPRLASGRVRHMTDDWEWIQVETLLALMHKADLLISVDSGPLHLARLTDIPVVGVFPSLNKYPARVVLPRGRSVCLVPGDLTGEFNRRTRLPFNTLEFPGADMEQAPPLIGETCQRMLAGPRYLDAAQLGADLQLQQFVRDWERGRPNDLTGYNDRHRGFDVLLREAASRFPAPVVVETGCVRGEEDWRGAGFGTYLLGAFLERHGGHLTSVDIDPSVCAFARRATHGMRAVTIVESDSVPLLAGFGQPIDVLVLDSMDTYVAGFAEHALREIQAALPWLHGASIVMFDDTVYSRREFTGKGTLAVPWLLEQGWRLLHSGYQVICVRP